MAKKAYTGPTTRVPMLKSFPDSVEKFDRANILRIFREIILNECPELEISEVNQARKYLDSGIIQQRIRNAEQRLEDIARLQNTNNSESNFSSDDLLSISSSDDEEISAEPKCYIGTNDSKKINQNKISGLRETANNPKEYDKGFNVKTYKECNDDNVETRNIEEASEIDQITSEDQSFNEYDSAVTASSSVCENIPPVSFGSFVSDNATFLMLHKNSFELLDNVEIPQFNYPLGVVYDEDMKIWMICDRNNHTIIRIDVNEETVRSIQNPELQNPSAITILKEGHSVAILCSHTHRSEFSIFEYNLTDRILKPYATFKDPKYDMNYPLRGLARSHGGNLLSLDMYKASRRLCVFNKQKGSAAFPLPEANTPSFIASNRDRVAVSDLGANKIYLLSVKDTDFSNIQFSVLTVISSEKSRPSVICNRSGFLFAAGLQFDSEGNLLVGDAKGHTLKLFSRDLKFLHRVSSDFPMPYMSSFFVNKNGEMIILDIQSSKRFTFAKLGCVEYVQEWIAPIRLPNTSLNSLCSNGRRSYRN